MSYKVKEKLVTNQILAEIFLKTNKVNRSILVGCKSLLCETNCGIVQHNNFVPAYKKGDKGWILAISKQSWTEVKYKIKEITRKTAGLSLPTRIEKLKALMRGWVNYFRMATGYQKFKDLDTWVRNRLRYCIWHDWKKPTKRQKALTQLGIKPHLAARYARTQLGGWAVAQSPIMLTSVTVKALEKRGYQAFTDYYISLKFSQPKNQKLCLSFEPPCTRSVRMVVAER